MTVQEALHNHYKVLPSFLQSKLSTVNLSEIESLLVSESGLLQNVTGLSLDHNFAHCPETVLSRDSEVKLTILSI